MDRIIGKEGIDKLIESNKYHVESNRSRSSVNSLTALTNLGKTHGEDVIRINTLRVLEVLEITLLCENEIFFPALFYINFDE